jgi:maleate isomerase
MTTMKVVQAPNAGPDCQAEECAMGRRSFVAALGVASGSLLVSPAIANFPSSDRKVWEPDGAGWRARIGVLTPDNDTIPEGEFWTLAPDGVCVCASRVPLVDTLTYHNPPGPDNAIELLARLALNNIVFAFTTSSYVLGTSGELALTARLEKRSKGIPVLLPCVAATNAFRSLAVQRIALIHPPWFAEDTVQKGSTYFQERGFEVVHASHMTPARENTEVNPEETYEWVRSHVPSNADGVFIAGNGFRTIGVIAALEEDLGRPVLTGNQAAFWYALRLAGVGAEVASYGQVFRKNLSRK